MLGRGDSCGAPFSTRDHLFDLSTVLTRVLSKNSPSIRMGRSFNQSLSPDETRLAFKERIQAPNEWRLAVLDLATLQAKLLNESRSVDDQVEWLDDTHILYAMPRQATGTELGVDIWKLRRGVMRRREFISRTRRHLRWSVDEIAVAGSPRQPLRTRS